MSLEERIELHEQWLRSMESNQAQFAENLGRLEGSMSRLEQNLANHQKVFAEQIMALTGGLARLAEEHLKGQERLQRLEDLVERYIRFRGNGNPPGN
jgi:septal ring factor EnvC (AmiA/AmiB activator)